MALSQDEQKTAVARAALQEVIPHFGRDVVLGIGTGSTADRFIDELAAHRDRFHGAVASSRRSADRLAGHGIPVLDLNAVTRLPVYVDGADEVDASLAMLKGGGGALTREKIVASVAEHFLCIVDGSKLVETLGAFALPVEVIPMARAGVVRGLVRMFGAQAQIHLRCGADGQTFMTDNGNVILDVAGLRFADARDSEGAINSLVGVVENGLFAKRGADLLLIGDDEGVRRVQAGANFS